jgi:hypothetical protein
MPKSFSPPKYRHFKPRDLAVVRINGRDHYLGQYGSPASREAYARLIAENGASAAETVDGGRKWRRGAVEIGGAR